MSLARLPRLLTLLLAAAGGLAAEAAFPARSWWPLAYVGIALLLLALRRGGLVWGWLLAFTWGLAFFLPHLRWADHAVGEPIGWLALSVAQAALLGLFGAGAVLARRARVVREHVWLETLALAALWVAVEQLRGRWPFGGLPWGTLAFSQTEAPLLRLGSIGSTVLVSALVVMAGAALAQIALQLRRIRVGAASAAALVAAGTVFAPWLVPLASQPEDGTLRLAAVQGDVPQAGAEASSQARQVTANHVRGTEALLDRVEPGDLDLVLWPESSADIDPRGDAEVAAEVDEAARAVEAPLLLGTQRVFADPGDAERRVRYNEVILWEPGVGPDEDVVYAKQRPVPFGEYMPYRDFFRRFTEAVDLVSVDMLPGDGRALVAVPIERLEREVPVVTAICFEVAYDDLLREGVRAGGELIVIPTNNASFGHTDLSAQQLAMSRFRAVEHGRAVVQVSTMGLSAVFTPNGVRQEGTGHWTSEQMVETVPLRTTQTLATRLGPWPSVVAVAGAGAALLAGAVASLRQARERREGTGRSGRASSGAAGRSGGRRR